MPAPTQEPHRQLTLYSGGGCCQSSLQGGLNLQLPVTVRTRNVTEGFVETHRVSPPQTTYRRGSLSIQSARRLNLQLAADDLQADASLAGRMETPKEYTTDHWLRGGCCQSSPQAD